MCKYIKTGGFRKSQKIFVLIVFLKSTEKLNQHLKRNKYIDQYRENMQK